MRTYLIPVLALIMTGSCAAKPNCFSMRDSVVLPDTSKVMGNLNNGPSGRAVAEAVMTGKDEEVTRLLASEPQLLTTQVPRGDTLSEAPAGQYGDLLTFAVALCQPAMIETLLKAGMPADGAQPGLALSLAILADTPDMAEILLNAGASPDPQKRGGVDVMREALAYDNLGAVMMLIRHRADMKWTSAQGVSHIQTAINMERYQAAEKMADAGASLWLMTGAGALPAHGLTVQPMGAGKDEMAARERLIARVKSTAGAWPPPSPAEVRKMVLNGNWPPAGLDSEKLPPIPEASLNDMKARFGTVN